MRIEKMFRGDNSYLLMSTLIIGVLIAVGGSVWATSLGTSLSVDSNISGSGSLSITSTTATSTFSTGGLTVGTSQFVVQQTTGNVGIGVTTPIQALNVAGNEFLTGDLDLYGADINLGTGSATSTLTSASGNLGVGTTTPRAAFSVQGSALISGNITSVSSITATGTVTVGANGTGVATLQHGFCDFGPIVASQTIAASSTGAVACSSQTPAGLAAGDKIWLTASTTAASAIQNQGGASNVIVGANYIYTGIASSTTVGSTVFIRALVYNLGNAAYTVTTSTWQYLLIK